jgi:acetylornithine deacetylase
MASELSKLDLDEGKFLSLLEKLIGESQHLQNNPPELVPKEDR